MSEKQIFKTLLEKAGNSEATGIYIPFDVEKIFGAKRVPVVVSINGAEYRSTIARRNGKYILAVPKVFREAAGVKSGETITVAMEKDTRERVVTMPEDLAEALREASLLDAFSKMSYTHQKEYVNAIAEAKREETRARRIEKTIEMLKKK